LRFNVNQCLPELNQKRHLAAGPMLSRRMQALQKFCESLKPMACRIRSEPQ